MLNVYLDIASLIIGGVVGVIVGVIATVIITVEQDDDFHWH